MKPEVKNALDLLSEYTSLLKLTKAEHVEVQNALDLIEVEILSLSPKPDAELDKDKSLA